MAFSIMQCGTLVQKCKSLPSKPLAECNDPITDGQDNTINTSFMDQRPLIPVYDLRFFPVASRAPSSKDQGAQADFW